MNRTTKAFLPNVAFPGQDTQALKKLLRVNKAGEEGAVALYKGQISATKNLKLKKELLAMLNHEEEHLRLFNTELAQSHVRPSALGFLWNFLGFYAGKKAARHSFESAMAQTEAVETVIEKHYQNQLDCLKKEHIPDLTDTKNLVKIIQRCLEDEVHHKNQSALHQGKKSFLLQKFLTKQGTRLAIFLAKRF